MRRTSIVGLALLALSVAACKPGGKGGDGAEATTEINTGTIDISPTPDPSPDPITIDYFAAGVTPADGDEIVMAGTVAVATSLAAAGPDTVLAFGIKNGSIDDHDGAPVVETAIGEGGKFKLTTARVNPLVRIIEAAKLADGTYDRAKIEQGLGRPIPAHITDADITAFAEEQKRLAADGGLAQVLVTMDSTAGDRFAQAQTFQFVGLPFGDEVINGIPVRDAKGNLGLGTITPGTSDQAKAQLAADGEAFSLDAAALETLANASRAMKVVRNFWINYHPGSEEAYRPTPFYLFTSDIDGVDGQFSAPSAATHSYWGMYLSVRGSLTFGEICGYQKTLVPIKLVPPASITVRVDNNGVPQATVSPTDPYTNVGAGAAQAEADRLSCNANTNSGFYGAGVDADDTDLMINWSGVGPVPEGYFHFYVNDQKRASFELASTSPFSADGNVTVPMPVLKATKDGDGKITRLDVKLYRYDPATSAFVEMTDVTGFRSLVSNFVVGATDTTSGQYEKRYSLTRHLAEGAFYVLAEEMYEQSEDGTRESDDAPQAWYSPTVVTPPAGGRSADSYHIQYEMLGTSYRIEFRPN